MLAHRYAVSWVVVTLAVGMITVPFIKWMDSGAGKLVLSALTAFIAAVALFYMVEQMVRELLAQRLDDVPDHE